MVRILELSLHRLSSRHNGILLYSLRQRKQRTVDRLHLSHRTEGRLVDIDNTSLSSFGWLILYLSGYLVESAEGL